MKRLLMMIGAAAVAVGATLPMAAMAEAKSVVLQATGYTGTATISAFQALVKLTEGAYGFSYNDSESTDGSDLWFEDSSGNLVPHDIDEWNEGGVSYVWVRIPSLTAIAGITMHWGEARTAAQTCTASDTWSGFAGVWHMNGTGTTSESDKTANGLDAAPLDSSNVSASLDTGTGAVGNGRDVSQGTFFKVSSHNSHLASASVFTIGGWVKRTGSGDYPRIFVGNPDTTTRTYWEVFGQSDTELHARGGGSTEHSCSANIGTDAGWNYLAVVFNGTTATVYTNGVVASSGTVNTSKQGEYFTIGGVGTRSDRSFVGTFDEVRMSDGAVDADRVAADYATMTSPTTFLVAPSVAVSATWTGEGAVGDCTDPANWDCRNSSGDSIADALPSVATAVAISGNDLNIQIPYGASFQCSSFTLGNCTLAADCDLRGAGTVTIPSGVTVDLKDRALFVMNLAGDGSIVSTANGTYTTLDAISTGGAQYILTGYIPASNDVVSTTVKFGTSNNQSLWCSRESNAAKMFTGITIGNQFRFDRNTTLGTAGGTVVAATDYDIVVDYGTGACKVNGDTIYTMNTAPYEPTYKLSLFRLMNQANGESLTNFGTTDYTMYRFRICGADGAPKLDLVPAKNASDVAGLWDRVSGAFYPSASEAAFVAGDEKGRGEVVFYVPSGATATRGGVTISASVAVSKEGEGTLADGALGADTTKVPSYCHRAGTVSFAPSAGDYLDLGPTNYYLSCGTLEPSTTCNLQVGRGRYGRFVQAGGTASFSSGLFVGVRAHGVYEIGGGTLQTGAKKDINIGWGAEAAGELLVSGGTVVSARHISLGLNGGDSACGGGSVVQSGGTMTCGGCLYVGYDAGGAGECVITNGASAHAADVVSVGRLGTGSLTVSDAGSVLTADKGVRVVYAEDSDEGTGTLVVTNGGKIVTTSIYFGGTTAANASVKFDGATVEAKSAGDILKDLADVEIGEDGLTVSTAYAVSVTNTTLKVNSGKKAITVSGTGSLDLANATVVLDSVPSNKFTLVEATGDATLSCVPALVGPDGKSMGNVKAVLSDDGKTITVKSVGLIITCY